jgi:hypothetical protein
MLTKLRSGLLVLLAVGAAGLLVRSGAAQEAKDAKIGKADPIIERMKKDITFLASDECEGRGIGTLGLDLAGQYIAVQFSHAGLKPGGVKGTYFQPFPFFAGVELDGESTLTLKEKNDKDRVLKQGIDFEVMGTSAAASLTAPVVFVGYGVAGKVYDDYAGMDVKGKIVIALRRLPRWNDKDSPFAGPTRDQQAALLTKQMRAQAVKAAALILVNDASEAGDAFIPFRTLAQDNVNVIPFVQMKRAVLDGLLKESADKTLQDVEKAIDKDLKPQSMPLKGEITLNVKIKRRENTVKNVIGVLEGKGPLANETVVVGAHYDHLGYGGFGSLAGAGATGKIHHGADDNGSGSTTVVELARRFGAMKDRQGRRMVFMTFTAEERGLIGSRHYCSKEPLFPLKDTVAMYNLDMVGRIKDEVPDGAKPKLFVLGMDTAKGFDDLLKKHNTDFELSKEFGSVFGASDHFSFYQQRIPVLFCFTGLHPDYHRPTDTSDKINVSGMKRVADFSERILIELTTDPKRPEFTERKGTAPGPKGPRLAFAPDYQFTGKGVLIDAVTPKGPAELAGMKKGDVIIEVAGKAVTNLGSFMTAMAQQKAGTAIEIKILRNDKEMQLKVTPQ